VIILIILAGIKPLEEAYRSRNQSCQLKIEVDSSTLTPELLKEALGLRNGQVKRFLVENRNQLGTDDLSVLLSKVSSHDIATFPEKLKERRPRSERRQAAQGSADQAHLTAGRAPRDDNARAITDRI
jgi:hypothetical protein